MEKINSNDVSPNKVSFEQVGENISFTLPGGETISVQGTFKGPELTSYEGFNDDGNQVQVEFGKNEDLSLFVTEIKLDGQTVYPELIEEELRDAA